MFIQFGQFKELHIARNSDGTLKDHAFITYLKIEAALLAIRYLNMQVFLQGSEKPLEVRFVKAKTPTLGKSLSYIDYNL